LRGTWLDARSTVSPAPPFAIRSRTWLATSAGSGPLSRFSMAALMPGGIGILSSR